MGEEGAMMSAKGRAPSAHARARRTRFRVRPLLRALHRDAGYLAIGLTFVYALSGIAVNHIADWDPNFTAVSAEHDLAGPLPTDATELARVALAQLNIEEAPSDVYAASDTRLEVSLSGRSLIIDPQTGHVVDQGQSPRFLLRAANWLHLNRGKRAWTYIADGYAAFLIFLAVSGLFMVPGRKGLFGRAGVMALLGVGLPIAYVALSGGP